LERLMGILNKVKSPKDIKSFDIKKLNKLAEEVREKIILTTSKNGGHLAASLGCVELGIALHYILDCPKDKIIWDVGHQAYVHKLLTGRFDSFDTLRKFEGISGFPHRDESEYDAMTVGHSSTSLASAIGFAKARNLNKTDEKIVAVIGDGSMNSGLALEALNNATNVDTKFTVILIDNEMSIAPNVGALSEYLSKIISNPGYNKIKENIENMLYKIPGIGQTTKFVSKKVQESIKNLVVPKIIFEEFGFRYFGPVDGHNLEELIYLLKNVINYSGPKIIHIKTTKGKGYSYAENNPAFYHGVSPFNIETGLAKTKSDKISFTKVFGETIVKLAEQDKDVVAITAAMPEGTGLTKFKETFPDRFFDIGISEDFAVTFSAGLSAGKKKPIVAIYSTFLQRSIDQIYHDVTLQKDICPILAIDRAGIVGADGPTHHGTLDLTYLLMIPKMNIMVPSDAFDLVGMLKLALKLNKPCAIRYPRGNIEENKIPELNEVNFNFGENDILKHGKECLILGTGPVVKRIEKIVEKEKLDIQVINCRFIKPLNKNFFLNNIKSFEKIITIEENTIVGGFGSYINNFINENELFEKKVLNIGIPDKFIEGGDVNLLYKTFEFDDESLIKRIKKFLEK